MAHTHRLKYYYTVIYKMQKFTNPKYSYCRKIIKISILGFCNWYGIAIFA